MMKSRSSGFVQKNGGVVPEIYTAFNMGKMMKISHCFGCKFWTKPDENTSQNIAGVNVGNVWKCWNILWNYTQINPIGKHVDKGLEPAVHSSVRRRDSMDAGMSQASLNILSFDSRCPA